ncbi:hypothetical protein BBJ28_00016329 [Nothophytophthora sp. Chile5]|nr:hypothetical protein BBJ28_00016329 [Nothophytophthora sp. Chile5]
MDSDVEQEEKSSVGGDEGARFGLVTLESLEELRGRCIRRFVLFRTVVSRIEELLRLEQLANASSNAQLEVELEVDELLQEIGASLYGNSVSAPTDALKSDFDSENWTAANLSAAVEEGVVQVPRRVQFARGVHQRLTSIVESVVPREERSSLESWEHSWEEDRREQATYFQDVISRELRRDDSELDPATATDLVRQLEFWMRRDDDLIPEELELMERAQKVVSELMGELEEAAEAVVVKGIPLKAEAPSGLEWNIQPRDVHADFHDGGGVYPGNWLGTPVAIRKVIDLEHAFFWREVAIWHDLSHPHIANLIGTSQGEEGYQFFVTEPAELGNVARYLLSADHSNEAWQKMYEVALALEYLHERSVIHAGLKPDNIRIGRDGKAKLTGFESSRTVVEMTESPASIPRGGFRWQAPEVLNGSNPSLAADVYSLAMCIILAVSGEPPWGTDMADAEVRYQVQQLREQPPRPREFTDEQWELVENMCSFDADDRVNVQVVVQRLARFAREAVGGEDKGSEAREVSTCEDVTAGVESKLQIIEGSSSLDRHKEAHRVDARDRWLDQPLSVKGGDALSNCGWPVAIPTTGGAHGRSAHLPTDTAGASRSIWLIPQREIFFDEFERRGGTSFVSRHLGTWLSADVAIEYVLEEFYNTGLSFQDVADLWFPLKHPNVLQLFGGCHVGNRCFFVCEYTDFGNLSSYLRDHQDQAWQKLLDVALGLRYLHFRGVVHGDLKCHNLLVDGNGKAKLAGFALCSEMQTATKLSHAMEAELEEKTDGAPASDARWKAPEVLKGQKPSFASDVYSLGMCIIETMTGQLPWGNSRSDLAVEWDVRNEIHPSRPEVFSVQQWKLVQRMCCSDPDERMEMLTVTNWLARFVAVDEAIDGTDCCEEISRAIDQDPNSRIVIHAMILDRLPLVEDSYANQGRVVPLVDMAAEAAEEVAKDDFEGKLDSYRSPSSSNDDGPGGCQGLPPPDNLAQQQRDFAWHITSTDVSKSGGRIGDGTFAVVHRGTWLGAIVAVKTLKSDCKQRLVEFEGEANIWYPLNHPHIINLFGACANEPRFFVCDFAGGGQLDQYLKRPGNEGKTWQMLYEAALGLQGVHSHKVVHADLKCNNILVTANGKAKLVDFGLSIKCGGQYEAGPCGAPRWKAPECLCGGRPTFESDVFSFGMCIVEAVTGEFPWGEHIPDTMVKVNVRDKRQLPPKRPAFEDTEWELVKRMCCFDPEERLKLDLVVRTLRVFSKRSATQRQGTCPAAW